MSWTPPVKKVSDVASYVKRQFGDESGVQITDEDIIRWVNSAQAEIATNNNILKAKADTVVSAGTYQYPLGQSMSLESINSIHVDGSKLRYLNFNDYETFINDEDPNHTQTGRPTHWSEWGGSLILFPVPDKTYTMEVYFVGTPVIVTGVADTLSLPDKYFQRIVDYVMAQAYELDENFSASSEKLNYMDSKLVSMAQDENKGSVDFYPCITVRLEDY
jgi:hypothetical protein